MKVAIYSRKSKFTGRGESIENQIELCKEYISFHLKDVKENDIIVFEDEGFSGKNMERPQLKQMMTAIRKGEFEYLICYRLDRISRSVGDFANLIKELNEYNVSFICLREEFNTSTPSGRAMMLMVSVFAQLERETIAERVRDNMMLLAKMGRWLGGTPPTGFLSERVEEVILEGKSKTSYQLKWNLEEIKIVKIMYAKFMELQSISGVSKYLIREKIYSRTGKYYSLLGIKEILSNPVYCIADKEARDYFIEKGSDVCFEEKDCTNTYGLLSYNKRNYTKKQATRREESQWIIAIGKHKGMISGFDWVMIQKKIAENKPNNKIVKTYNEYALLSGLIFCTKCGKPMFCKQRAGTEYRFDYICSSKMRGGKSLCSCQNLNGQQTDDTICNILIDYMKESTKICKLLEQLKKKIKEEAKNNSFFELEIKQKKLQEECNQYIKSLSIPNINHAVIHMINKKISELEHTLIEIEEQKKTLLKEEEDQEKKKEKNIIFNTMTEKLSYFKNSFQELTVAEQRELIRQLVERMEWDGEELKVFLFISK